MKRTTRLEATAYHEAGHAFAAWHLGFKVHRVTIVPKDDAAGRSEHDSPMHGIRLDIDGSDRAYMRAQHAIIICLAGPEAQRKHSPRSWRRHHGKADDDRAAELAFWSCGEGETATAYLKYLGLVARAQIRQGWPVIEAIAGALIERGTLTGRGVREIIATAIQERGGPRD